MPFQKSARIEIKNQSAKPLNAFYYHVDYVKDESLPPEVPCFCAQYRQAFPTASGRDFLILDAVDVREMNLGRRRLSAGTHALRFECLGQNPASRGAKLGVDSVRLRQRRDRRRRPPADR